MADYVMVHDRAVYEGAVRPALAAAWRARTFAPCLAHATGWAAAARAYSERYHVSPDDLLLLCLHERPRSDRDLWRLLVAEVLLVTAVEMPELPPHVESLVRLLAPGQPEPDLSRREAMAPVHQALHGSRDVRFGLAVYRPGHAGLNDAGDVARLARQLDAVRPEAWSAEALAGLPDLEDEDERADELAFAREWFEVLRGVYGRAAEAGRVMVLETIY
jgi:hypothetical protein